MISDQDLLVRSGRWCESGRRQAWKRRRLSSDLIESDTPPRATCDNHVAAFLYDVCLHVWSAMATSWPRSDVDHELRPRRAHNAISILRVSCCMSQITRGEYDASLFCFLFLLLFLLLLIIFIFIFIVLLFLLLLHRPLFFGQSCFNKNIYDFTGFAPAYIVLPIFVKTNRTIYAGAKPVKYLLFLFWDMVGPKNCNYD